MEPIGSCIEYTLGSTALDFRRERLAVGHTLSKLLLDTIDSDAGRVSVFFPGGLSVDQLQADFECPMLPFPPESEWIHIVRDDGTKELLTPIQRADSDLIAIVLGHLRAADGNLCIFENPLARSGDGWMSHAKSRMLTFGDDVYHVVRGTSTGEGGIRQAVTEADSGWEMIGALTSLPAEKSISGRQRKLTLEQMRLMAERTVKIFTIAYDGEGYLIWNRNLGVEAR